jgi:hypothetical protein
MLCLHSQAPRISLRDNDAHACAMHQRDCDHVRDMRGSITTHVFDIHELLSGFAVFVIVL